MHTPVHVRVARLIQQAIEAAVSPFMRAAGGQSERLLRIRRRKRGAVPTVWFEPIESRVLLTTLSISGSFTSSTNYNLKLTTDTPSLAASGTIIIKWGDGTGDTVHGINPDGVNHSYASYDANTTIQAFAADSMAIAGTDIRQFSDPAKSVLVLDALSIAGTPDLPTATLDLMDRDMIIQSATPEVASAALLSINKWLKSGYNGGYWTGTGIDSSVAAEDSVGQDGPFPIHGLAAVLLVNQDQFGVPLINVFDGIPVDSNSILIKYTYSGDTTLDGKVNIDDYNAVDAGFAGILLPDGNRWRNGDLDYNGIVNIDDYNLVDAGFGFQSGTIGTPSGTPKTLATSNSLRVQPLTVTAGTPSGVEGASTSLGLGTLSNAPGGSISNSDYSIAIDWGDGSPLDHHGTVAQDASGPTGTISGSHVYATAGVYNTTVTITHYSDSRSATFHPAITVIDQPLLGMTPTTPSGWSGSAIALAPDTKGNAWLIGNSNQLWHATSDGVISAYNNPAGSMAVSSVASSNFITDPNGSLWFAGSNGHVYGLPTSGAPKDITLPSGTIFSSLLFARDQSIWGADSTNHKIWKVTVGSDGTPQFTAFSTAAGSAPGGLAQGPDGSIWFVETAASKIGRITAANQLAGTVTEYVVGQTELLAGAVVMGPDGSAWFRGAASGDLGRITPSGSVEFNLRTLTGAAGTPVFDRAGNLWFAETAAAKIGRISASGALSEFALTSGSAPGNVVSGSDGDIWSIETAANKLARITSTGSITEYPIATIAGTPSLLTAGAAGPLWFVETAGSSSIIERAVPNAGAAFQINVNSGILNTPLGWFGDGNGLATPADYTIAIDWQDGSLIDTTSGKVIASNSSSYRFAFTGTHAYTSVGTFHPVITIHDAGGGTEILIATVTAVLSLEDVADDASGQPTFFGVADSRPVTVNVYAGSIVSGDPLLTLTAIPETGGAYSVTVPAVDALEAGTYVAQASQTDSSGKTAYSQVEVFGGAYGTLTAPADAVITDNGDGTATVSWDPHAPNSIVDHYTVIVTNGNSPPVIYGPVPGNITTIPIGGFDPNDPPDVSVIGHGGGEDSPPANAQLPGTVKAADNLAVTSFTFTSPVTGRVELSWTDHATNATGIQIEIKEDAPGANWFTYVENPIGFYGYPSIDRFDPGTHSATWNIGGTMVGIGRTLDGFEAGQSYYFRIRTISQAGAVYSTALHYQVPMFATTLDGFSDPQQVQGDLLEFDWTGDSDASPAVAVFGKSAGGPFPNRWIRLANSVGGYDKLIIDPARAAQVGKAMDIAIVTGEQGAPMGEVFHIDPVVESLGAFPAIHAVPDTDPDDDFQWFSVSGWDTSVWSDDSLTGYLDYVSNQDIPDGDQNGYYSGGIFNQSDTEPEPVTAPPFNVAGTTNYGNQSYPFDRYGYFSILATRVDTDEESFFVNHTYLSNTIDVADAYTPFYLQVAQTGEHSAALVWDNLSYNETGFVVERTMDPVHGLGAEDTVWQQVAITSADVAQWTDNNLAAGHTYYYRVKAVRATIGGVPVQDFDSDYVVDTTPISVYGLDYLRVANADDSRSVTATALSTGKNIPTLDVYNENSGTADASTDQISVKIYAGAIPADQSDGLMKWEITAAGDSVPLPDTGPSSLGGPTDGELWANISATLSSNHYYDVKVWYDYNDNDEIDSGETMRMVHLEVVTVNGFTTLDKANDGNNLVLAGVPTSGSMHIVPDSNGNAAVHLKPDVLPNAAKEMVLWYLNTPDGGQTGSFGGGAGTDVTLPFGQANSGFTISVGFDDNGNGILEDSEAIYTASIYDVIIASGTVTILHPSQSITVTRIQKVGTRYLLQPLDDSAALLAAVTNFLNGTVGGAGDIGPFILWKQDANDDGSGGNVLGHGGCPDALPATLSLNSSGKTSVTVGIDLNSDNKFDSHDFIRIILEVVDIGLEVTDKATGYSIVATSDVERPVLAIDELAPWSPQVIAVDLMISDASSKTGWWELYGPDGELVASGTDSKTPVEVTLTPPADNPYGIYEIYGYLDTNGDHLSDETLSARLVPGTNARLDSDNANGSITDYSGIWWAGNTQIDSTWSWDALNGDQPEEVAENDAASPGRFLAVDDQDSDNDGVPNFADGFDLDGSKDSKTETKLEARDDADASYGYDWGGFGYGAVMGDSNRFTHVLVQLPAGLSWDDVDQFTIKYDASDPALVTTTGTGLPGDPLVYTPDPSGSIRLWTDTYTYWGWDGWGYQTRSKDSFTDRDSEDSDNWSTSYFVPSGSYDADAIKQLQRYSGYWGFFNWDNSLGFMVEAVAPSLTPGDIKIEFSYRLKATGQISTDTVHLTAFEANLHVGLEDSHTDEATLAAGDAIENHPDNPGTILVESAFDRNAIDGADADITNTGTPITIDLPKWVDVNADDSSETPFSALVLKLQTDGPIAVFDSSGNRLFSPDPDSTSDDASIELYSSALSDLLADDGHSIVVYVKADWGKHEDHVQNVAHLKAWFNPNYQETIQYQNASIEDYGTVVSSLDIVKFTVVPAIAGGADVGAVRSSDGSILYSETDMNDPGQAALSVTRTWSDAPGVFSDNLLGTGWNMAQWPKLIQATSTIIAIIGDETLYFDKEGDAYISRFGSQEQLNLASDGEYVLTDASGNQFWFNGFDETLKPLARGRFNAFTDPGGNETSVTNETADGRIIEITSGGSVIQYTYEDSDEDYAPSLDQLPSYPKITSITWKQAGADIETAYYVYYENGNGTFADGSFAGNDGDLAAVSVVDETSGNTVSESYYRYTPSYLGDRLTYVVDSAGLARAMWNTAADDIDDFELSDNWYIAAYAEYSFAKEGEYVNEGVRGAGASGSTADSGIGNYSISIQLAKGNITNPNQLRYFTTITQPGMYSLFNCYNDAGELLYSRLGSVPKSLDLYDAQGRPIIHAAVSAIDAQPDVDLPLANVVFDDSFISSSEGLVTSTWYSEDAGLENYISEIDISRGEYGDAIPQVNYEYDTQTVDGISIHPLQTSTIYSDEGGADGLTTTYGYVFGESFQPTAIVTTSPPDDSSPNFVTLDMYDSYGDLLTETSGSGYESSTTKYDYDPDTGALIDSVVDWGGDRLNLVTTYQSDPFGRTIKVISPGRLTTTTDYTDSWSGSTIVTTAPDDTQKEVDSNLATGITYVYATTPSQGVQLIERDHTDISGRVVETEVRPSSEYAVGSPFPYITKYSYDFEYTGRYNSTETIDTAHGLDRTVTQYYNLMGELVDDGHFNTYTYDISGNVTQVTQHVGAGLPDRITDYAYDWRNRQVAARAGGGNESTTHPIIVYNTLNNLGWTIQQDQFDGIGLSLDAFMHNQGSPHLLASTTTIYDALGRGIESDLYPVDPVSHQIPNNASPIVTNTQYDSRGRTHATTAQGNIKTIYTYDGADRVNLQQILDASGTQISSALAMLDVDGRVLESISEQDASRAGDSAVPTRVSYSTNWYNNKGQLTATANWGTNPPSVSSVPPSSSAGVLVTGYAYNSASEVQITTDPMGHQTSDDYDWLGRLHVRVNNFLPGASLQVNSNQLTSYVYDGLNRVIDTITLDVSTPGTAGSQQHAPSTYDNDGPNPNLILNSTSLTYTTAGGTTASYQTDTYDNEGEVTSERQHTGVVHHFTYDQFGRVLSDSVVSYPSGVNDNVRTLAYTYDAAGRMIDVKSLNVSDNIVNEVTRTYNGFGQILTDTTSGPGLTAQTESYTYVFANNSSQLDHVTYPDGYVEYYHYDAAGRVSSTTDSGGAIESDAYTGGTLVALSRPISGGSLTLTTTPDAFGRVGEQLWKFTSTSGGGTTINDNAYGYNLNNQTTYMINRVNGNFGELYGYDPAVGLYDGLGRSTGFRRGTVTLSASGSPNIDAAHMFEDVAVRRDFAYDLMGTLLSIGTQTVYNGGVTWTNVPQADNTGNTFDGWGRLVVTKNGDVSGDSSLDGEALAYDGLGRLIGSTTNVTSDINGHETIAEQYVYSAAGQLLLEYRNQSGDFTTTSEIFRYIYDGSGMLVRRDQIVGSTLIHLYALTDWQNNTLSIVDSSGTVLERYIYDAFGSATVLNGDWSRVSVAHTTWSHTALYINSGQDWTILFHGQTRDIFTGGYLEGGTIYSVSSGHSWEATRSTTDTDGGLSNDWWMSHAATIATGAAIGLGVAVGIATGGIGSLYFGAGALTAGVIGGAGGGLAGGFASGAGSAYESGASTGGIWAAGLKSGAIGAVAGAAGGFAGAAAGEWAVGAAEELGLTCQAGMGLAGAAFRGGVEGLAGGAVGGFVQGGLESGSWQGAFSGAMQGALMGAGLGAGLGALFHQMCFVAGTEVVVGAEYEDEEGAINSAKANRLTQMGLGKRSATLAGAKRYLTCPIELLKAGDWVLTRDENSPDGELVLRRIEETFIRTAYQLITVKIRSSNGQMQTLRTTAEHPMYALGKGWIACKHIEVGDLLQEAGGGLAEIIHVRHEMCREGITVYNFRVNEAHTYFVREQSSSAEPIWVHNAEYNPRNIETPFNPEENLPAFGEVPEGDEWQTTPYSKPTTGIATWNEGEQARGMTLVSNTRNTAVPESAIGEGGITSQNYHHPEVQMAYYQRLNGIMDADVFINHPNGPCGYCAPEGIENTLFSGQSLTVHWGEGISRTFFGRPN